MSLQSRATEEQRLEFLVGEWHNSGQMSPGPFGAGGPVTGETNYHWAVGGKWLLYVSRLELPGLGSYEVRGGVTFNSRAGKYDAYAINSLGNLLVYEGDWTDEATLVFTVVHPPPRDRARVVYHRLPDGSFKMTSETVSEEGEFVPYFEIRYLCA
ncbi:MAG: DUF1579 family protein [Anaerolineae bacterium]